MGQPDDIAVRIGREFDRLNERNDARLHELKVFLVWLPLIWGLISGVLWILLTMLRAG